ncbi:efflux RND transporter periplasmic adaptor subunit [Algoriphagus aquimarinus]|uniref:Membrane fusion protein, cobalt-zinc-cadmium efflux system n=1 Tax=Algoriphagus aquimarinus TaxID=237018 RepID=A0A1I1BIL5_9BACT|nr:efflux RND transporter periplasmic adaptor subunit [Algoriphagus aquimarinus]SFB50214.1 membrane fusion protein, cobalt-zinc-cadmium efflux system [Algoriphagus aquimarinus]
MKNSIYISIITLFTVLASCKNSDKAAQDNLANIDAKQASIDQVELSQLQIQNAEILIGYLKQDTLSEIIKANGLIELPPNDRVSINALYESFIEKVYVMEGASVKKGDILVSLKHPNFIQLQQEYQQSESQYRFLQKELQRQQILSDSNFAATKTFQQIQADFESIKSQRNALAEKLSLIGINSKEVSEGKIHSIIYLTSPITGTVTKVTGFKGQSILPQQPLLEVINNEHAYLELNVFEKHINSIQSGQKVDFKVSSFENSPSFSASIFSVGNSLDLTSRTIKILAKFQYNTLLIQGLYVEADIYAHPTVVSVLPEAAIIFDQNESYVFVQDETTEKSTDTTEASFTKTSVKIGRSNSGLVQILDGSKIISTSKIVVQGANYLKSELGKGEGDDD